MNSFFDLDKVRRYGLMVALAFILPALQVNAQSDSPCECAQRWEGGGHWNPNNTVDDTPNAPEANGIIRCGSSAETQSQVSPGSCVYNPALFTIDVGGGGCVEPSSGNVVSVINPTPGQPIIWLNFDIRPNAGTFQIQINDNSGDEIGWALYHSNNPTAGVALGGNNLTTDSLSGNCASLGFSACGVESASTWNTIPVPVFNQPTNYYLAIWDQDADGNLNVSNFKARFGCGDADVFLCNLQLGDAQLECNNNSTYTVEVPIMGINGQYVGFDPNATPTTSAPVCLTNPGDDTPVTSGTILMTYPSSVATWNITVSAQDNPANCIDPLNVGDCTTSISGSAPSAANALASGGTLTCANTSVQLTGSSTTNGAIFEWTGPNNFASNDQNPSASVAGIYTLVVSNGLGCSASDTALVSEDIETPGAQADGGTITCLNECVTLSGSGGGSFSWSGPNNFESTEQNPQVCAAGTYILTVTGTNGCTSQDNAEVILDTEVPGAQADGGTITCLNECVTLSGSGDGSYSWSGPNNFESTEQNPQVCAAGTYILTVTGTNGCTSQDNAEVILDTEVPGAQADGGTITCLNECVTLSGSGNGSYSWSGPNNFESTEQNPQVCAAGTYVLTVTAENGCVSQDDAEVILDTEVPGAQADGGTITCLNECVTLSGSGNGSYSWSGPNNFESTEQNPQVCAAGTYVLTVTAENGCVSQDDAEVILDTEVPGAQADGGTITCLNECVTLSGSGNGSYSWSGPNNFESAEQNPQVCAAGTYILTVTGTNGCTSQDNAEVILDTEVPGAQADGGTITCLNECVTLSGSGGGSFSWSGPNNFESTEQNPQVCAAGTYILTVTGTNGCTSQDNAEVILDTEVPGAQADGGTITCLNECVTLSGSGNGSYSWSGPNNFESTEQNPQVCAPGTYVLTVTAENGCVSQDDAEVILDTEVPGAQADGGTITCLNECVTLSGSGNGSYSWSGPNNFESTEQNPQVCAAGTYVLTVTAENGCVSQDDAEVILDTEVPGAQADGGTITCLNECVTLSGSGGGSFSWSGPNNFESTEQNPQVCAPGTYVLTVTAENGCVSQDDAEVILDTEVPGAQADGGTITCLNECVTLSGSGGGSFSWSGPNNFESTEQNPQVCAAGTYVLTVTAANGCVSQDDAEVILDTEVPGAQADGGTITCLNECVTLSGSGDGSYSWSGPNNFESTEQNPQVCAPGTYVLTVTAENGCVSQDDAEVILDTEVPGAQADGGTITCLNECVTLSGSGNGSYSWSGPNNFESTEQNPQVCAPGTYVLTVTAANGCVSQDDAEVEQDSDVPGAQADGGTITCKDECVTLSGSGNGSYAWTGPNNFESTEQNPQVCAPGTYVLTVTAENGCSSQASAVVGLDTEAPGAQADGGTITCLNECVTLSGSGDGSYSWSGPNNFESTEQNPQVCAAGTYVLTVTAENGCVSQDDAEVILDTEVPGAQADGGTITCLNECVTLSGSGGGSFSWSGPNNFESTEQNPQVCAPGTYVLTVTAANGCVSQDDAEVILDTEVPGAQADGGTITCLNECVTLSGSGGGSFSWTGPNNFESTEQNPQVCAAGTYVLTVTGENGCTSQANAEVEQDSDVPGAQADGGTITCKDECVTLSGSGDGSYSWSGPNNFESTEQNPQVCVAGTYVLTVTGENGCVSQDDAVVILDTEVPGTSAQGGTLTCSVSSVTLSGGGDGTFAWSGPNGFTSTESAPVVYEAGIYTLTVTGANGCTSSATAIVEEDYELPQATVSATFIGCNGEPATLSYTSTSTITYQGWAYSTGIVGNGATYSTSIPGTYYLVLWGANGCHTDFPIEVVMDPNCEEKCGPLIISCPEDLTVQCAEDWSPFGVAGEPVFRKDKKCPKIIDVGWTDVIMSNCPYVIQRTYWAEDETGAYETCTQIITVIDEVAPVINDVPSDVQVSCDADIDAIGIPEPWAYDECTKVMVNLSHNVVTEPGSCPNSYSIVHTWTATDQCGNTGSASWRIEVVDNVPPVILCTIEDIEVNCAKIPAPAACKVQDNCDPQVIMQVEQEIGLPEADGKYVITRTYTATDDCGNSTSVVQLVTVWCDKVAEPVKGGNTGFTLKSTATASPNPFNERSMIVFHPKESGNAMVEVRDLQGRMVMTLFNGAVSAEQPVILEFQPTSATNTVYIYRIVLNGEELHGRLLFQP